MKKLIIPASFILTICLALVSCQGNPVDPGTAAPDNPVLSSSAIGSQVHHCLGFYSLVVDTETLEVESIPTRTSELHLNLTGVLNTIMGVSAAGVPSEHDPPNGLFVFDITLTHPFGTVPQLAGFDIKGILMTPGSLNIGSLVFADADETRLENADGYTRWWNPTEFTAPGLFGYTQGMLASAPGSALTATNNPYKYFADALYPESLMTLVYAEPLDSDTGRGVFTAGSSNTRRYRIRFPMDPGPQIVFGYAVDASWKFPSPNPPDEVPDDFPIDANQPEAFHVHPVAKVNTLYYDSESGIGGGVLRFLINVHDWQGMDAGDIAGQIDAVRLFSPDLFSGAESGIFENETSIRAQYSADLTGTAIPTQSGEAVVAVRAGSAGGPSYNQGLGPAPDVNISAWDTVIVPIEDPDCSGDANNEFGEAVQINPGEGVEGQVCLPDDYRDFYWFEAPVGYNFSGSIVLYCDAEPTTLGVYNSDEELLTEDSVSDGIAAVVTDNLELFPGTYYIRIFTSNDSQVSPYYLEMDVEVIDVTPDNPVEVTPDWLFCSPGYHFRHGNYLIMNGYKHAWVYDVSDPANPVYVSSVPIHDNFRATFNYPYMYFLDYNDYDTHRIGVVDFTDIENPEVTEGLINNDTSYEHITMNSEYLFVLSNEPTDSNIRVYDYNSNPQDPAHVRTFTVSGVSKIYLYDPEGPDTHLLMTGQLGGARIDSYEIEDIMDWTWEGMQFEPYTIDDVYCEGIYVYVLSGDALDANLTVMHISSSDIYEDDNVALSGALYGVAAGGNYAYVSGVDTLQIIDVAVATDITYVSSTPIAGTGFGMIPDGNTLSLLIHNGGVEFYDISFPPMPDYIGNLPVVNEPSSMVAFDNYIILCDSDGDQYHSLKTVDISIPSQARVVAQEPLLYPIFVMCHEGNVIAARTSGAEVTLFDTTDPLNVSIHGTIPVSSPAMGMIINNNTLYFARDSEVLLTYDISTPSSPAHMNTTPTTGKITHITINDDYLYADTDLDAMQVFSIANPWNPAPVGSYTAAAESHQVASQSDYLYICTDTLLEIADLSTPTTPVYTGSVLLGGMNGYRYIDRDRFFAYLMPWWAGSGDPVICSLWPADVPGVIYTFADWPYGGGDGLEEHNGFLYIQSGTGLRIFDLY